MGARLTAIAGVAAALALLAGCGGDGDTDADDATSPSETVSASSTPATAPASRPTTTPAPAGTPECAAVWQVGETLPRVYRGCALDGLLVAPDRIGCSSGQALVRYDDRYWAVAGGPIAGSDGALLDDKAYTEALMVCRG